MKARELAEWFAETFGGTVIDQQSGPGKLAPIVEVKMEDGSRFIFDGFDSTFGCVGHYPKGFEYPDGDPDRSWLTPDLLLRFAGHALSKVGDGS